jgi:hypothetical protein
MRGGCFIVCGSKAWYDDNGKEKLTLYVTLTLCTV